MSKCAFVADDGNGNVLAFDPIEDEFFWRSNMRIN
jgi:hypothetical protein